ncbi:3-isopropylmalate dehydratase large subunit [Streptomyces sp. A1277]|uniref:3-isopropylmalate dehydratase large subunit n=1 Tax=Streptomyces sp. A1277 TaxID=2563103 RepID=UPI0010A2163E|nr:3-isopropylmalate dehydratase large subunit [Streptomyces sp. A1277]THA29979.1 3-isopropylmalate dehydratase large subunit [Streptomyces sp. A1277]
MAGTTLASKIWQSHLVRRGTGGEDLLYIDMQLLHEVNTPQAFDGLRAAGRTVRRPDLTVATEDHSTPTIAVDRPDPDEGRRAQRRLMGSNSAEFGIPFHRLGQPGQGIYAVIAPELGLVQPGMTIVCCDSHTTTLGAFGALSFGIGTSQVEHVLATQTLPKQRPRDMRVTVEGRLPAGVTAKDLVLSLIARYGTQSGQDHIVEYRGEAVANMSMEARMTLCNMTVEMGSAAGIIAADRTTLDYLDHPSAEERAYWLSLRSDDDAVFDKEITVDAGELTPYVSWGTNPGQSVPLDGRVPAPEEFEDAVLRAAAHRALDYMDLRPGTALRDVPIDLVFLGSCTNGRIEDLRAAADVLDGRKLADGVRMVVVPGSMRVRAQAVDEGLDQVFLRAGAEFRAAAGCSMCVSLGEDRLSAGTRSASTSNRNFEGRQGPGARTHLVSPPVAAATAVTGRLAAPADL